MTDTPEMRMDNHRLDVDAWIEAALLLLAEQGIDGVRVEILAKRLNVTKGSFYWHFKDRDSLHQSMLEHWRKKATIALIERLDRGVITPSERFRRLMRVPFTGRGSVVAASIELAVRLWGRRDQRAAAVLAEIDNLRLEYIGSLLRDCGCTEDTAKARAVLAYSYMRVASTLLKADAVALMTQCENILVGADS